MKKKLASVIATTIPAPRRRTQTDAQVTQTSTIAMFGSVWNSLDDLEKSTWVSMAQQLHSNGSTTIAVQPKVSAYLTFISTNTAVYNTVGTVQRQAAPAPIIPLPIPPGLLDTSFTPGSGLRLTLHTAPYTGHVLVYGAPPVPAGQNIYKKKGAFKLLGSLTGLSAANDLSSLYNAKFRCTGMGSKIAIKLVGVSASGTRSPEQFISGITAAVSAQAVQANDSDTALKAA